MLCRWLILAEELQLDGVKAGALAGWSAQRRSSFKFQMKNKHLDGDLGRLSEACLIGILRVIALRFI